MDANTAKDITQAIRDVSELKLKIKVLEQILANERPSLYMAYQQELESLTKSKAHSTFLESLAGLTKRLQGQ